MRLHTPSRPDGPSPVREAWKSLDTAQRSGHDARAKFEFDVQRSATSSHPGQTRGTARSSNGSAGSSRRSKRDASGTDRGADGTRGEMSVEDKKTVDGFVKDIVQQVSACRKGIRARSNAPHTAGYSISGLGDELPLVDGSSISTGRHFPGPLAFSDQEPISPNS
jgi:hypothetical protein